MIFRLPAAAAAHILRARVGAEVHVGGVEPHEEGLPRRHRIADEALGFGHKFIICGFHPLAGERSGALDPLATIAVSPAVQHAAGGEALAEIRKLGVILLGVIA